MRSSHPLSFSPELRPGFTVGWIAAFLLAAVLLPAAWGVAPAETRRRANAAMADGNYADAFRLFEQTLLEADGTEAEASAKDLDNALWCLQKINRVADFDAFAEKAVARHTGNWHLLWSAAKNYEKAPHYGYLVAGKFRRGPHRAGGQRLDSFERDRAMALQLMDRALRAAGRDADAERLAQFHIDFANLILMGRDGRQDAWRLQDLTDFAVLPDYEESAPFFWRYATGAPRGAPADETGKPIFHALPRSYEAARGDGERWRWMLDRAGRLDSTRAAQVRLDFADFLHGQFGVQTLRDLPWWSRVVGGTDETQEGIVQLHTLSPGETLARLAVGVRRFALPDEFNYIRIYADVAQTDKGESRLFALQKLAAIYENRRQYEMASNCWQNALHVLEQDGAKPSDRDHRDAFWRLKQITGNWGDFEPVATQAAGRPARMDYRFRNGERAGFNARRVKVGLLLDDVRKMLRARPDRLDYEQLNLENIGYRLVSRDEERYLEPGAEAWVTPFEPRPGHLDRRITVETPLTRPGAYLVTATMDRGNMSRVVLWIADTAIVKKRLTDGSTLVYVADARSGAPVGRAHLDIFGYRQERSGRAEFKVEFREFQIDTGADGMAVVAADRMPHGWQWVIVARTDEGREAFLGWTFSWPRAADSPWYDQPRTYVLTDRPVYRPGQTARFKVWVREVRYDQGDASAFANREFRVEVRDPRNESVFERTFTTDEWGGLDGEVALPADAPLGDYSIRIPSDGNGAGVSGAGRFRVEEYRKPEFEVLVEAPEKPVELGGVVEAVVRARYYFGEPVRKGRLYYKVSRTVQGGAWRPERPWDWLYGRGYAWREGAEEGSGARRGGFSWMPSPSAPPEVVAEGEVDLKSDGAYTIPIDTSLAKAIYGDSDHNYRIVAEVTDASRRTIAGEGQVIAARQAFEIAVWTEKGYYRAGDKATVRLASHTADGRGVGGAGRVTLERILVGASGKTTYTPAQSWEVRLDDAGRASLDVEAAQAGQYRVVCSMNDAQMRTIEGSHRFTVTGAGGTGSFRYEGLEIAADRTEYAPGSQAGLLVGAPRAGATVLLFVRPEGGYYTPPRVLKATGGAAETAVDVGVRDMPNFFVEALAVYDGGVHTVVREVFVPPDSRVLDVAVEPSRETFAPGEEAVLRVKMADEAGNPYQGAAVLTVYDRSVEYISGGTNVDDIREFFWKWRRDHRAITEDTLSRVSRSEYKRGEKQMADLGVFGGTVAADFDSQTGAGGLAQARGAVMADGGGVADTNLYFAQAAGAPPAPAEAASAGRPPVAVRRDFADTACWNAALRTGADGTAEVRFRMPDNLTAWKVRAWGMGQGTRVGEETMEIVTRKDLIARLQTPRFLIAGDTATLSAVVHNYLPRGARVAISLESDGNAFDIRDRSKRTADVASEGEVRVDWEVRALRPGKAALRLRAESERSDAVEQTLEVMVHGADKSVVVCGHLPPEKDTERVGLFVPGKRREDSTRLEIRFSPSLAVAMTDALPYLVDYPFGCTEQTLNRFLPTAIVHKTLRDMGFDLAAIAARRSGLDPQTPGAPTGQSARKDGTARNAVFDAEEVARMTQEGVRALADMQLGDGGWGWFSGYGERASAHTTAWVVRGLLLAREAGVALPETMLSRGVTWLRQYRDREAARLAGDNPADAKKRADDTDALVYCTLGLAGEKHEAMRGFLYRDRSDLSFYSKALLGLAMHREGMRNECDMLIRNIEQVLKTDRENQTAWLELGGGNAWWRWYGSDVETQAAYLKLLAATGLVQDHRAPWLVKYLLNNRKQATRWNSTRDTALCIEAFADYLRATGEAQAEMRVEVFFDKKRIHSALITPESLFALDNTVVVGPGDLDSGRHTIEIRKRAAGATSSDSAAGTLYFNARLSYFSEEDFLGAEGLETRVERNLYRLVRLDATTPVAGARGQATEQPVEKYARVPLRNKDRVQTGDLVEVELTVNSKNDYEYMVLADSKAAGFEPVEVRSGYNGNALGAYVEYRDRRVLFFIRDLARGRQTVSYRLRAEAPGIYAALPAEIWGMYAPDLRGNSDEIGLRVEDRP